MKLIILYGLVEAAKKVVTPLFNADGVKYSPYSKTLNCGECIAAGYVYCQKIKEVGFGKIYSDKNFPKKADPE